MSGIRAANTWPVAAILAVLFPLACSQPPNSMDSTQPPAMTSRLTVQRIRSSAIGRATSEGRRGVWAEATMIPRPASTIFCKWLSCLLRCEIFGLRPSVKIRSQNFRVRSHPVRSSQVASASADMSTLCMSGSGLSLAARTRKWSSNRSQWSIRSGSPFGSAASACVEVVGRDRGELDAGGGEILHLLGEPHRA